MFDYCGEEPAEIAEDILEQLKKEEIVELIVELYFLLETPERVDLKRKIS